jgi:lambda repressor-like predicted transcriptional regulator
MKKTRVTNEEAREIIHMVEHDGMRPFQVSKKIGRTNATILNVLKRKQHYLNRTNSRTGKNIPQWTKDEILSMHKSGLSFPKITQITGVKISGLRAVLKEAGIKLCHGHQGKRLTKRQIENILKLRKKGLTLKQIAKKYKVSDMAVLYHIRKNSVK